MRYRAGVWGFFIIALIVITGCTSPQSGAIPGSNSQNSDIRSTNVKMTSAPTHTFSPTCNSLDPLQVKKFLPDIPGWLGVDPRENKGPTSYISDTYKISDSLGVHRVTVSFSDVGSCAAQDESINGKGILNSAYQNFPGEKSKINNFHGYPAVKGSQEVLDTRNGEIFININDRLVVEIAAVGLISKNYSLSDADADIEKCANAIDFNGFAALV